MMRLPRMAAALAGAAAILTGCNDMKQIKHMPYPRTERTDVTDNYFGTEVPDPYRWLEDDNSEATAAWVKAQNVVTQDYLSQIPFRGAIRERLTELWNYPKEGIPAKHGDAWYYFYNDGLRNQSVLYRTVQPGGEGEVFIDPNTLSEDGSARRRSSGNRPHNPASPEATLHASGRLRNGCLTPPRVHESGSGSAFSDLSAREDTSRRE